MSNPPVSVVWDMLSKAPQLRNLLLEADKAETLTFVPTKVSLPKLETLYLRRSSVAFMSSYTAHLECPKVHYLNCAADQLARIDPFVQQRAHNIKTFVIHEGTVNVEAISTLKLLQKASTVEINGSAVQAGFWDALMAQDEVVLPALTKLRLVKVELDSDDDSLPRFVKSRRAIASAQTTTPATSQQPVAQRLQRVEFVSADALPSWFVAEIQYIMAQDK
ncbi:hypothetical protein EXIGLDRAFT_744509 [Exidia glandulosa HHB12029]|uniref:F-box domain-containing protein n=1 Tax=Exidia glandulosa HHB12029 TaxID=1314781 RepID=A0A165PU96_EXIGL|nr:hypothetical protein EXIGLDRAFT_744509 [Exidia glandulosa HHB12029]